MITSVSTVTSISSLHGRALARLVRWPGEAAQNLAELIRRDFDWAMNCIETVPFLRSFLDELRTDTSLVETPTEQDPKITSEHVVLFHELILKALVWDSLDEAEYADEDELKFGNTELKNHARQIMMYYIADSNDWFSSTNLALLSPIVVKYLEAFYEFYNKSEDSLRSPGKVLIKIGPWDDEDDEGDGSKDIMDGDWAMINTISNIMGSCIDFLDYSLSTWFSKSEARNLQSSGRWESMKKIFLAAKKMIYKPKATKSIDSDVLSSFDVAIKLWDSYSMQMEKHLTETVEEWKPLWKRILRWPL